ncbi:B-box zinc finger protein [Melittangium boletus]|uniref:Uncharacterized protein n=1 Tax=Melittangium boletus DSM 14713 TaxID=1294270 RepID=A0A250IRM8_9BACT|nr:B-box zinc finger protein [Melittangium boletus]ATB33902.1 hypothetical protein MEBOL_007403 [Melittangium boletus DSM 14713]
MQTASTPCPNHPTSPATFTCARCGSFACEACRSPQASTWCASCAARYASPGLPVSEVLGDTFGFLMRHPGPIALLAGYHILFGLAQLPFNMAMQEAIKSGNLFPFMTDRLPSWIVLIVGGSVFSSIAYALFIRFAGDALEGPPRPTGELVNAGLRRALPVLGTNLLLGIALGVGFILCLAPGVFLSVTLALALPATVLHPSGPIDALSFSWTRTRGHRGNLFLLLVILGAIFMGVGIVNAGVNLVVTPMGLGGMAVGSVITQALSGTCVALMLAMLVCCYLRLTGRWLPVGTSR